MADPLIYSVSVYANFTWNYIILERHAVLDNEEGLVTHPNSSITWFSEKRRQICTACKGDNNNISHVTMNTTCIVCSASSGLTCKTSAQTGNSTPQLAPFSVSAKWLTVSLSHHIFMDSQLLLIRLIIFWPYTVKTYLNSEVKQTFGTNIHGTSVHLSQCILLIS